MARNNRLNSSRSTSCAMETSSTLSRRACRPRKEASGSGTSASIRASPRRTGCGAEPAAAPAIRRAPERLARPENLLETVHRAPELGEQQSLVDDDRPTPERGGQQPDHDDLDDDMRRPEHREQRGLGIGGDRCGGVVFMIGATSWGSGQDRLHVRRDGRRRVSGGSAPQMGQNLGSPGPGFYRFR